MGISDLLPFLRKRVPHAFQPFQRGLWKRVAVDVPLMAHKFACVDGSTSMLEMRFEQFVKRLSQDGFTEVHMVFDGQKTALKDRERQSRKEHREKVQDKLASDQITMVVEMSDFSAQPTSQDQTRLKAFFERHANFHSNVTVHVAQFEAEAKVSWLVRQSICDIALSEDSDCLAFLSPRTLLQQNKPSESVVHLDTVLSELKMTPDVFQVFCILCGCDFLQRLPLVGPAKLVSFHEKEEDLLQRAQACCKDASFVESHQKLQPEVLHFFQTCANEQECPIVEKTSE